MTEKMRVTMTEEMRERFREWLYERENAEATIRKYLTDIRTLSAWLGEDQSFDKGRLLTYKSWLLSQYAASSVNSMLASLNQFLRWLGLDAWKIKQLRIQKNLFLPKEKELSKQEFQSLVRAARLAGKDWLALCMETIAATGIRISELKYFTVESVEKGRIEVWNKGKHRRIFLPASLGRSLLKYCRKQKIRSGCIFRGKTGKPKDRSQIWREMKELKELAGVDGGKIFPHSLRHLFARAYYRCTKDLAGLADLLGHSSLSVTRIYTANSGEIYQRQLEEMGMLLEGT